MFVTTKCSRAQTALRQAERIADERHRGGTQPNVRLFIALHTPIARQYKCSNLLVT